MSIVYIMENSRPSFPYSISLWDNMRKAIRNALGSYLKIKPRQTPLLKPNPNKHCKR